MRCMYIYLLFLDYIDKKGILWKKPAEQHNRKQQ